MLRLLLKILLGLLAIRVVYFFVRYGMWQFTLLEDKCINGTLLEAGTYLVDEGDDQDYVREPWSSQCGAFLAQLPPEALDRIRQITIRDDSTIPEQQIVDGIHVGYIAPTRVDNQPPQSGRFRDLTSWWAQLTNHRGKIKSPPCSGLRSLAQWVCPKKTFSRVFEQHFADVDVEYIEALAQNDPWKARWVHVRGILGFWATVVVHINFKLIGAVIGVVRATFGL
jgi:hypothetical protein